MNVVDRVRLKRRMAEKLPESETLMVRLILEESLDSYFKGRATEDDRVELDFALTMALSIDRLVDKRKNEGTINAALVSAKTAVRVDKTHIIVTAVAIYHEQLLSITRGQFEHACQMTVHEYRKRNVGLTFP